MIYVRTNLYKTKNIKTNAMTVTRTIIRLLKNRFKSIDQSINHQSILVKQSYFKAIYSYFQFLAELFS